MKKKFKFLLTLFVFSFMSFALGWFFALSSHPDLNPSLDVLGTDTKSNDDSPKDKSSSQNDGANSSTADSKHSKEPFVKSSLFKNMKDNVMMLFNPYELDRLSKKNTLLEFKTNIFDKSTALKTKTPVILPKKPTDKNSPQSTETPSEEKNSVAHPSKNNAIDEKQAPSAQLESFITETEKAFDKRNKEQLLSIENQQNFFKSNGKFSFLVNVFSKEEKAIEYVEKMKKEYPLWSFLLKFHGNHIRVYLGPFLSKEEALKFKNEIPIPYPFSSLEHLEDLGL